jgi:hypothetical protein
MQLHNFRESMFNYQEGTLLGVGEAKDILVCQRWIRARDLGLAVCTLNYCLQNPMNASAHSTSLRCNGF